MPSLKDLRNRIKSVISTQQITSAMKLVAASKLRRAQEKIINMRPYANKLNEILSNVTSDFEKTADDIFSSERPLNNILIVVITSNKGLCGAFNSNIIKKVNQIINENYHDICTKGKVHLACIGKKGYDYFKKKGFDIVYYDQNIIEKPTFDETSKLVTSIMKDFTEYKYDKVLVVYNMFKNAAVQIVSEYQFLPILTEKIVKQDKKRQTTIDYIYEPDKETILTEIIPKMLKIQFFRIILDSSAAEHGARMTAMHKATDNATELLRELRLTYNKMRQAQITKEIVEVVSGANALES